MCRRENEEELLSIEGRRMEEDRISVIILRARKQCSPPAVLAIPALTRFLCASTSVSGRKEHH